MEGQEKSAFSVGNWPYLGNGEILAKVAIDR